VERKGEVPGAASPVTRLIDQGWSLLVFAEGTRSRDGTVGRLRSGAAVLAEGAARASGRTTSLCRARVRTILHGHRYDGSRAERELGLRYTPVAETFRRTIDWAVAEGLVTRPLRGPDQLEQRFRM
jgi:dihydroflavonol-4-reductase